MKNYESPDDALNDLRARGYEADFEPQSDCLYCSNLDLRLFEEEFHIDEAYHFKVDSGADDNAVVYALSAPGGLKGTIVDELHASSETINVAIAKKLQNHPAIAGKYHF
jgi:hypothetical protein